MSRIIIFILIPSLILLSYLSFSCGCPSEGNFLKVKRKLTYLDATKKQTPMAMEVEILNVFKGKEGNTTIIVWGNNEGGTICRLNAAKFNEREYYVIAVSKSLERQTHKEEKVVDYYISVCGEYALKADMDNKYAQSFINDKVVNISLAELKESLSELRLAFL